MGSAMLVGESREMEVTRYFCAKCGHGTRLNEEGWCSYGCDHDGCNRLKKKATTIVRTFRVVETLLSEVSR